MSARIHCKRNWIHILKGDNNRVISTNQDLVSHCKEFFGALFTQTSHMTKETPILPSFPPRVISVEDSFSILEIPSEEEIKHVVFSFDPNKASGPDGFNA